MRKQVLIEQIGEIYTVQVIRDNEVLEEFTTDSILFISVALAELFLSDNVEDNYIINKLFESKEDN